MFTFVLFSLMSSSLQLQAPNGSFAAAFQASVQPRRVVTSQNHLFDKNNALSSSRNEEYDVVRSPSSNVQRPDEKEKPADQFDVQVAYEGRVCNIQVRSDETILAAMERTGAADELSLPSLPYDCRRGNCLTCTGKHSANRQTSSIEFGEDGLSPHMSKEVRKKGYILTCSSHVVGDGVSLELGLNSDAWTDMHKNRLEEEPMPTIGRAAMAREIRRNDEKDLRRWAAETKSALEKSGD